MKIYRFVDTSGQQHLGTDLSDGALAVIEGDLLGEMTVTDRRLPVAKLLAPIVPTAIMGIGLNYGHHAEESGMAIPTWPVVFFKGPNTLQHPNAPIVLPTHMRSDEVDYECELAIVIGKACKNVAREDALDYVLGYTCANDVSARDWQIAKGGSQWCRGKSFDTFSPLGPCITTSDEIPNPNTLGIKTILNGTAVQDWNTNDMIFDIPEIISFLSGSSTLLPGTVIFTGTPHGVGMAAKPPRWLKEGDEVTIEIEGIGQLTNPVVEE